MMAKKRVEEFMRLKSSRRKGEEGSRLEPKTFLKCGGPCTPC
jgi:hypothetical protein